MKAAVLWTGGKDSTLAFYRAIDQGIEVVALVTFEPVSGAEFKAHPQTQMKEQAKHLQLPIQFIQIKERYQESYIEELQKLKRTLGISSVVTGDIDYVNGQPNWIVECCAQVPLNVIRPLWQEPREALLKELFLRNIHARISWINHSDMPQKWMGRTLDLDFVDELKALSNKTPFDICGENGEYHTMVDFS